MPRSVPHNFDGQLADVQLRVWERRSERSLHAIAEGRYVHRCASAAEHQLEIASRWDIPAGVEPWHSLALRARDREEGAARTLAQQMIEEAVGDEWTDPCGR